MQIIEYNSSTDIVIKFLDRYGYIFHAKSFDTFLKGAYRNPYYPEKYGIGMLGEYKQILDNHDYKLAKRFWNSMIERCYSKKYHKSRETYHDCSVCEEWHVFSNFYKWFHENYYEIPNCQMHLDKDILLKGNKIYCPEYCCIVPQEINQLFTKSNALRGKYPIGVSWIERDKVFRAQCNDGHKNRIGLGDYNNPTDAFIAYKKCKEKIIKKIADNFKEYIPQKLYEALYRYEVEITD